MTHTRGTRWAGWARRLRTRHAGTAARSVPRRFVFARTAARGGVASQIVAAPVTVRLSVHPILRFDYRPPPRAPRERELWTRAMLVVRSPAAASMRTGAPPTAQHPTAPSAASTTRPERPTVPPRPALDWPVTPRALRRPQAVADQVTRAPLLLARRTIPSVARRADHGSPAPANGRLDLSASARLRPRLQDLRQRIEAAPAVVPRQLARRLRYAASERSGATTSTTTPAAATAGGATAATTTALPTAISLPDVGHLTEQVIREIDRRILAHRERMGRGAF
jgi:hypothetical protein